MRKTFPKKPHAKPGGKPPKAVQQRVAHPLRIQRQRGKGWRMPKGAVYCGRPSEWGSPITSPWPHPSTGQLVLLMGTYERFFRDWLEADPEAIPALLKLKGKQLACWCKLSQACHVDVMLRIIDELTADENDAKRPLKTN